VRPSTSEAWPKVYTDGCDVVNAASWFLTLHIGPMHSHRQIAVNVDAQVASKRDRSPDGAAVDLQRRRRTYFMDARYATMLWLFVVLFMLKWSVRPPVRTFWWDFSHSGGFNGRADRAVAFFLGNVKICAEFEATYRLFDKKNLQLLGRCPTYT